VRFWDSSAVVPLLVEESSTAWTTDLYRENPSMCAWWGTEIECISALARLERQQGLAQASFADALRRLRVLKLAWHEVQPVEVLKETAARLLRVHALRAGDSLQLAAAILASEHRPSSLDFVCLDQRLAVAAAREGFNVTAPAK
jgi:predicted nucleic acid-binding protein